MPNVTRAQVDKARRSKAIVVGIDSSTQSTKVEARDLHTGKLVAQGRGTHPPTAPPVSEQNPQAWWDALVSAMAQLGDHRDDVVAMAVAGQQHGLVLLDDNGRPLRDAKLWNDTTSAPQADGLVTELGPQAWADQTGSVPVASFTVTKLAWVAANEPDLVPRIAKVMLPHDYLTWRLTGEHVTDRGDASGTGWFDPSNDRYLSGMLSAGLSGTAGPQQAIDWLPKVLGPTEVAGSLTPDAASELGLPVSVVVGPGTGDNMAGALGLGLTSGDVAISLGTSGTVYSVSDVATNDELGAVAGFADATGRFLPLVCTLNATKVTDTVAGWLGTDAAGLSELALAAGNGLSEVVLVPYFDGERTPNRPEATGRFFGLTNQTTREELARAAHDGVLLGLIGGLDALVAAGVAADQRIVLIGGGARSGAYRQRLADLLGRSITVPDDDEVVATGAAVQAAAVYLANPAHRTDDSSKIDPASVATTWGLGAGMVVEPCSDVSDEARAEAQSRYRAAISFR